MGSGRLFRKATEGGAPGGRDTPPQYLSHWRGSFQIPVVEEYAKRRSRDTHGWLIVLGNIVAVKARIPRPHLFAEEKHFKRFRLRLG
jgi:hypothetical protein